MKHWPTKTLAALGPLTDGDWILKENYTTDGVRLIQVGDVGEGAFIGKSSRFISAERAKELQCSFLKAGDILVSRMPDPLGRACIFPGLDCPAITAVDVAIFRPESRHANPRFINYFLNSRPWFDEVLRYATGTTRPRISRSRLEQMEIPVPPLAEQERIVKLLDEADELRKLRSQADRRTSGLISALFHEMFGELAINSMRWPMRALGDITRIDAPMVDPRLDEYLDLPHVGPERIEGETGKVLSTKTAREDALVSGKFLFDESHVLYSKIRPYLRKVALPDFGGLCSADVYPVTPEQTELCREYLWAVLLSKYFTKYAAGRGERTNIPKVNRSQFNAFQCPLPPLRLQKEFAERVTEIRELGAAQAASRDRLDDLFQSLLHRAFEGEL